MKKELTETGKEIISSVIRLHISIKNNNPSGLMIFVNEFIPLLKRFQSYMQIAEINDQNQFADLRNEFSNLFDYLFAQSYIFEKTRALIPTDDDKGIIGLIIAKKHNGNPLPSSLKKYLGTDLFEEFVSKYNNSYVGDRYLAAKYGCYYAIKHKFAPSTSFQNSTDKKVNAIKKAAEKHGMKGWKNFQTHYLFWEVICQEREVPDQKYCINAGHIITIEKAIELLENNSKEFEFANILLAKAHRNM